jgi:hypothetical protein
MHVPDHNDKGKRDASTGRWAGALRLATAILGFLAAVLRLVR